MHAWNLANHALQCFKLHIDVRVSSHRRAHACISCMKRRQLALQILTAICVICFCGGLLQSMQILTRLGPSFSRTPNRNLASSPSKSHVMSRGTLRKIEHSTLPIISAGAGRCLSCSGDLFLTRFTVSNRLQSRFTTLRVRGGWSHGE